MVRSEYEVMRSYEVVRSEYDAVRSEYEEMLMRDALPVSEEILRNKVRSKFEEIVRYKLARSGLEEILGNSVRSSVETALRVLWLSNCLEGSTVNSAGRLVVARDTKNRIYLAEIQNDEPEWRIVCELRLFVYHNPNVNNAIKINIHGLWMGFIDCNCNVVHLINKYPSEDDHSEGREQSESLDPDSMSDMRMMWPDNKGNDEEFWVYEFTKHALTALETYKRQYFKDTISVAGQYIEGQKDLQKFLGKYEAGMLYNWKIFNSELKDHIGSPVRIVCSKTSDRFVREIGILFSLYMKLIDFPRCSEGADLMVRRYAELNRP